MASAQDKLEQNEAAAAELLARGFLNSTVLAVTVRQSDPDTGRSADKSNPPPPNFPADPIKKRNGNLGPGDGGATAVNTIPSPPSASFSFRVPQHSTPPALARTPGRYSTHARTALADCGSQSGVHPVIHLGWQPICNVVCNGLQGEFLGGHDRDIFIRCTSGHYANLPLVDVGIGGCIMTCSQFEKLAGRELSKKWKESIHVVGEGEGSKATLIAWLKRRAEKDFGHKVVGRQVWVCWCADADYYQGTIIHYNRDSGKHTVQYNSRLTEDLHLPVELLSFQHKKPDLAPSPLISLPSMPSAQPAQPAQPGSVQGTEEPIANGIWHQGSGVSVSSMVLSEANSGGSSGQSKQRRCRQGMLRGMLAKDDLSADPEVERPPKRTLSAPASVLLAAALNLENCGLDSTSHHKVDAKDMMVLDKPPAAAPVTPMQPMHSEPACQERTSRLTLPPPPRHDRQDGGISFQGRALAWMDEVALVLDDEMGSLPAGPGTASFRTGPTISGTFQAMIALLRSCPTTLEALFQGMVRRYDHFARDPCLQRRKLCEYIASSVHEPLLHHVVRLALPRAGMGTEDVRADMSM